jgi:hypothetical protein
MTRTEGNEKVAADLKMTMRYARLSQGYLREPLNLVNHLSSSKEMVNTPAKTKRADNPSIPKPLQFLPLSRKSPGFLHIVNFHKFCPCS